jgi:predicted molibdopterin-dependent oxidoreductase YjgC
MAENMISLTIDDVKVEVEDGSTIIQAARAGGVWIPTLCYLEGLPPWGSCRLCLVEVEGDRRLNLACASPARDGMVVHTRSERVDNARRLALELLLADHPLDCPVCERSGDCELQDITFRLWDEKFDSPRFRLHEPKRTEVDKSNPFLIRNYNRCVYCGRCVSACKNLVCNDAIDFINRGYDMTIGSFKDGLLQDGDCVFCGQCVEVCPVGALTTKRHRYDSRAWFREKTRTICPYCGVGCTLELHTHKGKIHRVTAPEDGPANHGTACVKGRFGLDFVEHPDRLKKPQIRKDGALQETSWDEALATTAEKIKEIKEKSGPDAIAFFSSAKCTNEENYILQKIARAAVGTNNVDHCARL